MNRNLLPKMPQFFFLRLIFSQVVILILALTSAGLASRYYFKNHILEQTQENIQTLLHLVSVDVPQPRATLKDEWCINQVHGSHMRLTILDSVTGRGLCDSVYQSSQMEGLLTKPEIATALRRGYGEGIRFSFTSGSEMYYGAIYIPDLHMIVRAGMPLVRLRTTLRIYDMTLFLTLLVVALIFSGAITFSGRALVQPMERSFNVTSKSLNTISDGVFAVDLEGLPIFYNEKFQQLFPTLESILGHTYWKDFQLAMQDHLPHTSAACEFEIQGEKRFFTLSISPLRPPKGDVFGAVGIFYDVTDLKRAEQQRIDFVANVSHELRTPLTAIRGASDTLVQEISDDHKTEKNFAAIISRNANRLTNLIDDLLDLSFLESQHKRFIKEPISTQYLTEKVLQNLEILSKTRHQKLSVETAATEVMGDSGRIEQVLMNLVTNAIKYTPERGSIKIIWQESPKNEIILRVQDSGKGIAIQHLPRLFERFYRVDKARSRDLGGTGLGLAIVKHIVLAHGGRVWVESTEGQGSTFFCSFPG